jgi:flagellar motility protein MotE (MotC chaperone)
MIRFLRDIRLVPIVLFATISLFALKTLGLIVDGRYTLGELIGRGVGDSADITGTIPDGAQSPAPAPALPPASKTAKPSWAQQMFGYPDITGSVPDADKEKKGEGGAATPPKKKPEEPPKGTAGWTQVPLEPGKRTSPAEQAILERLQERRAELDARARELEMRESLLRAAEKRVEGRVAELKELEQRAGAADHVKQEGDAARFKNLVTMYENMKAKDAAKIFDRLDLKILVEVATQINPRRMSDILAQMSAETAERLTVELAVRSADRGSRGGMDILPKIEGKPTAN